MVLSADRARRSDSIGPDPPKFSNYMTRSGGWPRHKVKRPITRRLARPLRSILPGRTPGGCRSCEFVQDAHMAGGLPHPTSEPGCVLGIDPGLQRTGYAVLQPDRRPSVREAGVIRLSPRQSLEARLLELDANLAEIIARHAPTALICEALYAHYRHPRTAILMGHARGVILARAARHGMAVQSIAPTQVKKLLTGSGRAGKVQVQRAIAATLHLAELPEPNDVADAMAIALCGLRLQEGQAVIRDGATQ